MAEAVRADFPHFLTIPTRWMDNDVYGHVNNALYYSFVDTGMRVGHIGNTSVRYEVALFAAGEPEAAATGYFVHVFVDRQSRHPALIPPLVRTALGRLRPA